MANNQPNDPTSGTGTTPWWASLIQSGANIYGSQNAGEQMQHGSQAGINTYGPQSTLGNNAFGALNAGLGMGGNMPDLTKMPGYNFAVDQGTKSINAQASAMGNLYTPNTLDAVGKYVSGSVALPAYQNYISNLMGAAGFGQNANANISQLQQNKGVAGGAAASNVSGAIGNLPWGQIGKAFGGGGSAPGPNNSGVNGGPNTGTDASGGYTDASGNYIGPNGPAFNGGSSTDYYGNMNTGYDNSQTDLSQSGGAWDNAPPG
jgi:hypothetical protein